jgi:hypothetical protein
MGHSLSEVVVTWSQSPRWAVSVFFVMCTKSMIVLVVWRLFEKSLRDCRQAG